MSEETISAVRVRFGRRERRGVILGLVWSQIFVIAGCLLVVAVLLWSQAWTLLGALIAPIVLVGFIGVCRWRREPLLVYVLHIVRFWREGATKQWVAQGGPTVVKAGRLSLPGGLGGIDIHQTSNGLGFSYDPARRQFTFTLTMDTSNWPLLDESQRGSGVAGFVSWMNGLTRVPGLMIADVRMRTDFSSSTDVSDYTEQRIQARLALEAAPIPCPSCGALGPYKFCTMCGTQLRFSDESPLAWSDEQAREAAATIEAAAMEFSYEITFVLSLTSLRDRRFMQRINRAGGGLDGAGQVLELEAATQVRALSRAGVTNVRALTADQIRLSARRAYDPETLIARQRDGWGEALAVPEAVRPLAAMRRWDHLRIDETYHQVFWIGEWPTSGVPVGFLEELVRDSGEFTRCVTLQLGPVSKEAALKKVNNAQTDLDQAETTRQRMGQRTTREQEAEAEEVTERETDLSEGYREMVYRGFITTSTSSREEMDEARNLVEVAAGEAQIEPKVLYWQQPAAFNTAVLPFGLGAVKK